LLNLLKPMYEVDVCVTEISMIPQIKTLLWDSQSEVVVTREAFYLHFLLFIWWISRKRIRNKGCQKLIDERKKETKGSKCFPFWYLVGFCFQLQWDKKSVTKFFPRYETWINCRLSLVTCQEKLTFCHSKENSEYKRL